MNINLSDENRNIAFIALLLLIVICLFTANNLGNKQDKDFKEESEQYKYALQLLGESKMEEAGRILEPLVEKHPENPELLRSNSIVLQQEGNYKKAAIILQEAQNLNPSLILDPTFLAQYGEVLFNLKDFAKAKVYLEESLKLNPEESIANAVKTILDNIEQTENE